MNVVTWRLALLVVGGVFVPPAACLVLWVRWLTAGLPEVEPID